MAISAVLAAVSTGVGVLAKTIVVGSIFKAFAIRFALGVALNALTPKPPRAADQGYRVNSRGPALDHPIIYGRTKVGGVIVYETVTGVNNKFLHRFIVLAGHEIESFDEFYMNDELVTLDTNNVIATSSDPESKLPGKVRILVQNGTDNQTAISEAVSEIPEWTTNHRLRGLAYVYLRFSYDRDAFPSGVPNFSAVVKGRKVLDPRTSTTAWSANAALCRRDYLTAPFGMGEPSANIDDDFFGDAADICDETVEGEPRYECNGTFTTAAAPADVLQNMLLCDAGTLWYAQGKWRTRSGAYPFEDTNTSYLRLDESDLRSGINVATRHSRRNNFNVVKGTFVGEDSEWQPTDYPRVTSPAFVAADGGIENVMDLPLPFVSSPLQAQRVARIVLFKNREQLTIRARFGLRGMDAQIGDVVLVTNARFGWSEKAFEVIEWNFGMTDDMALEVEMTLRETSEEVYQDVNGEVFESNNTTLPSPFAVPRVGIDWTVSARVVNEALLNVLTLTLASDRPNEVDRVEVEYKADGQDVYTVVTAGDLGRFEIIGLLDGNYTVRARAVNPLGVRGAYTTLTSVDVSPFVAAPANVAGLTANVTGRTVFLEWDAVPDLDLSHYRIRHSFVTTGATWADATTAEQKLSRPGTSVSLPMRSGTYLVRAYDKLGFPSDTATQIVVPATLKETFATTDEQIEHPSFAGVTSGDNLVVNSGSLELDDPTLGSGEYVFSDVIDTGSVRQVWSYIELMTARVDRGSGFFDDIPGVWDSWVGLFDDLTGTNDFDDTDVKSYISVTDDDPTGTPTWGPWQRFKAGVFSGRAFRFKVELLSTSPQVTPGVTELKAVVEY